MKTIYVDRNVAFIDGFNKVLDEAKLHQENTLLINSTFSGLYMEPNFYKAIEKYFKHYDFIFTDKKNKELCCDIYLSNNANKIKGNSNLKILYSTSFNLDNVPLDDNIYIIKSWEELNDILNFYKDYEIDTLEKKEQI